MGILCWIVQLYILALLARIILSWFPISPNSAMSGVFSALYSVTEPVLGPVRRALPPVGGGGIRLDLSPIIVILAAQLIIQPLLC